MSNCLQILQSCNHHAGDYFSRLGGSGRYQGFMHWHIPALVLLVSIGETDSSLLPEAMWRDTDQLPEYLKSKFKDEACASSILTQFINDMTTKMQKIKDRRELEGLEKFLSESKLLFSHLP